MVVEKDTNSTYHTHLITPFLSSHEIAVVNLARESARARTSICRDLSRVTFYF